LAAAGFHSRAETMNFSAASFFGLMSALWHSRKDNYDWLIRAKNKPKLADILTHHPQVIN